jgi:hypothetical protein
LLRELTLAYVALMAVLSWWEGRRRESVGWAASAVVFLAVLGLHAWKVIGLRLPADTVHAEGWVQLGGWLFVLKTAIMSFWLIDAPSVVVALVLPAALLGLAGWGSDLGRRVAGTVLIFVSAYLIVGQKFNYLWGLMYVGLMPLGLIFLPSSMGDLLRASGFGFRESAETL